MKKDRLSPAELIALTNQVRAEYGLAPLKENPTLSKAAQARADDMNLTGSFSHKVATTTPNVTPWTFMDNAGVKYRRAGENLARDFKDATSTVEGWKNSPTHMKNLLQDYTDIGVAVVKGKKGKSFIVQFLANQ